MGRGCPLSLGKGSGEGAAILILDLKMVRFGAFWVVFIAAEWLVLHAKQALGASKT